MLRWYHAKHVQPNCVLFKWLLLSRVAHSCLMSWDSVSTVPNFITIFDLLVEVNSHCDKSLLPLNVSGNFANCELVSSGKAFLILGIVYGKGIGLFSL